MKKSHNRLVTKIFYDYNNFIHYRGVRFGGKLDYQDLETQTLHPPQWTEEMSNHETKQLNGTIYRCSWMFDDKVFYESSIQIDESGDHTFKSPWKCL